MIDNLILFKKFNLFLAGFFLVANLFSQDITTGLQMHYSFTNVAGSALNDNSGNGNAAVLNGNANIGTSDYKTVLNLDGVEGSYLAINNPGNTNVMLASLSEFSIACWVYVNKNATWARIFDFGSSTSNYMFLCPQSGSGNVRYAISYNGVEQYVDGSNPLPEGVWSHVTVTYSGTTAKLYVNGLLVGQNGISNSPVILGSGNFTQNYIGKSQWPDPYLNGDITDFRLFNRELTTSDIGELINEQLRSELQSAITEAEGLLNPTVELTAAIDIAKSIRDTESTTSELTQGIEDLSASIFQFKLDTASVDNPLNMTEYIVNPSFESLFNGWTNDGLFTQTNTAFPEKAGSIYVERWVNSGSQVPDVSIKQLLTGIPNGNYILSAGAGNIQQSTANPQTGAFLFAGYRNTAVDIFDVRQVNFTVVDNQVPIGFKTENATGNWVACDNFSLHYVGPYNTDDYALHVSDLIDVANGWLSQNVQNSAKAELNNAISTAQAAIGTNPLVFEDLTNGFEALKTAINDAEESMEAYANLQDTIDYANEVLGWYSDNQAKKNLLEPAIIDADAAVNNFDLTLIEINNATADLNVVVKSVDKQTHIPTWMMGDVNNPENNWSYSRSKQSKNWILFWEPGFGNNSNATIDDCLALAETCFEFYANTLKFITIGDSKTDQYKMIIRLRYDSGWEASGSGVDDTIGLLTLTPWALSSRGGQTIAHEVGHCFQYQVHCDNNDFNGWIYGFGAGASGGNGWWEQCAQWQAYKIFPFSQFNNEWFGVYMNNVHKNILHEAPRYENFFIQDYWSDLHGIDIIGRLWNESIKPEDPVEAYKRITGINQNQFNDEIYYCGAKFTTWDIPALKSYGAGQVTNRPQPKMNQVANDYWMVDPSVCPENYGHNIIKLNAPAIATTVTASFEGLVGASGFRNINGNYGGWRYGFVALKTDGTRVYSEITETNMTVNNGIGDISFECPANTSKLWFVVSGAPTSHWRHAWDDNNTNDEQWPYKVRFVNTNRLGFANVLSTDSHVFKKDVRIYSENQILYIKSMPLNANLQIFTLTGSKILNKKLNDTSFSTMLSSGIYIVTIEADKERQSFKVITR